MTASARDLSLDRVKLPAGFTIGLHADDVSGARSMALVPGTLYVTEVNHEKRGQFFIILCRFSRRHLVLLYELFKH